MKIKTLIAVAALGIFAACGEPYRATTATVVVAPGTTKASFRAQYPYASNVVWMRYDAANIPIDWELAGWTVLDDNDYLVRFDMDNNYYYAWYDKNGNWIGTSYGLIDYNSMPVAVVTTLTNKYPGYTITSVNKEFQRDRIAYEVELKNDDTKVKVLVDIYGNVVKAKTRSLY